MEKQEIETIIDTLDQATLALKFYVATGQTKYLQKLHQEIVNLQELITKKGARV
jgi:hydrogenase maturation factor